MEDKLRALLFACFALFGHYSLRASLPEVGSNSNHSDEDWRKSVLDVRVRARLA